MRWYLRYTVPEERGRERGGVRRPREAESRVTEDTFDEHDLGVLQEMIVRMYWKGVAMEEEERAVTFSEVSFREVKGESKGESLRSMHVRKEGTGAPGGCLSRWKGSTSTVSNTTHMHMSTEVPSFPMTGPKGMWNAPGSRRT